MRSISVRYWLIISLLLGLILVVASAIELALSYRDDLEMVSRVQQAEARAAGALIEEYLRAIEAQIREAASLPWTSSVMTRDDRRTELHRLMKLVPAILELRMLSSSGNEIIYVSRTQLDRYALEEIARDSSQPIWYKNEPVAYGPTYFREGSAPYTSVVVRIGDANSSDMTIAEINLTFVADVIAGIKVGREGKAFIVDRSNHLVAHPSLSLVLSKADLSSSAQVLDARLMLSKAADLGNRSLWTNGLDARETLTSAVKIGNTGWILLVEQPSSEVLGPVRAGAYRAFGVLLAGLLIAFVASRYLARSLTQPILRVRDGAARIGAGDLAARIDVKTGDEIESLANEFNRMASQLQQYTAGLELQVQARTLELTGALSEVDLKRKEAENANAAKTRFLAAASHDLRQPMHAISLLVGILHDRIQYPEVRLLVDKVQMSVRAMENLFDSLLDISKLDAGAVKPNIGKFEIAGQLRLAELNYTPLAKQKGLELRVFHSRAVVNTDAALLERIIGNLISNAIRYTAQGCILVGCRRRGPILQLLVFDTGIGIAPENLGRIFEEFFQVANPESDRSKGLGLGLSIVKRSADLLEHGLIVKSVPGKGSMFGVELPFVRWGQDELPGPLSESIASNRLKGAFLVVIDDDQENLFAMEALCIQWGCLVVSASSSEEAIGKLENHLRSPDLIISDYRLRDYLTGVAAVQEIRGASDLLIPAIIVTGDLAGGEASRISVELVTVMSKPVNAGALRAAAEALLELAETRGTAA